MVGAHLQTNIANSCKDSHLEEEEVVGDLCCFYSFFICMDKIQHAGVCRADVRSTARPGFCSGPFGFNSLKSNELLEPKQGHVEFCTFIYSQLLNCSGAPPSLLPLWCAVLSWLPF